MFHVQRGLPGIGVASPWLGLHRMTRCMWNADGLPREAGLIPTNPCQARSRGRWAHLRRGIVRALQRPRSGAILRTACPRAAATIPATNRA